MVINDVKGQASIEFILVLLLALVFITTIIQPNAEESTSLAKDTANIAKLRVTAEKIANAINYVSLAGEGTKQEITTIIPANGKIICNQNNITFEYEPEGELRYTECINDGDTDDGKCTKIFRTVQTSCGGNEATASGKATVEKNATGISITFG